MISFHIDILRRPYQFSIQAFKSQMCFEQKSTRDPKVFCSTRTKSKRNSSRLDMHRGPKTVTSHSKTLLTDHSRSRAVQQPLKGDEIGYSNGSIYIRRQQFRNIFISSNGSSYSFKQTIVIRWKGSPELSVPKQSPTFRTARRNPLKKHTTLFVQKRKKKHSSQALSNNIIPPSAKLLS